MIDSYHEQPIILTDPHIMAKVLESALGDHNFSASDLIESIRDPNSGFASDHLTNAAPFSEPGHSPTFVARSTVKPTISNLMNPILEEHTADIWPDIPWAGDSSVFDDPEVSPVPSTWATDSAMSLDDVGTSKSLLANFSDGLSAMDIDEVLEHNYPDTPSSPMVASRKRSRTVTSALSQRSPSTTWAFLGGKPKKSKKEKPEPHGTAGISKSAVLARDSRLAEKNGAVDLVNMKLREKWRAKIREDDPNVKFFDDEPRRVVHSRCGNSFKVKQLYDCYRWRTHLEDCDGTTKKRTLKEKAQKNIGSLFKFGFSKVAETTQTSIPCIPDVMPTTNPCPGLTEHDEKLVPVYLQRSGAMGGGSRSIMNISKERFSKVFSRLAVKAKTNVLLIQANEHTW